MIMIWQCFSVIYAFLTGIQYIHRKLKQCGEFVYTNGGNNIVDIFDKNNMILPSLY